MNYEEEISDLVWIGRRLDKALYFIKTHYPDSVENFLVLVEYAFERIILEDLNLDEEYYLIELLDESLDGLEEAFDTIFENKHK